MTFKFWKGKEFLKSVKSFGKNFIKSAKALWEGQGSGVKKHAGKIIIGLAALSSVLGIINSVTSSKTPSKTKAADVISKDRNYIKN